MRFLLTGVFWLVPIVNSTVHAHIPLGDVAATFSYIPSKVLADPRRNRVYVADVTRNSVEVIDTPTLDVIASVPIGSDPVDMAISLDGNTLYVANAGSTAAAITALDLNSLKVRGKFALPGSAIAVAAGLSEHVYAIVVEGPQEVLFQLDGTSGIVETTTYGDFSTGSLLQTNPAGTRLYVNDIATLQSYDVSASSPSLLQTNVNAGSDGNKQLAVSHNGKYLCYPSGTGNSVGNTYMTFLYSTANINTYFGTFDNGPYPGPLAFSPNDSLVYQTVGENYVDNTFALQVYDTQTFAEVKTAQFPGLGSNNTGPITSIATDKTGSYLFVGESALDNGGPSMIGQLLVVGTGVGDLSPRGPTVRVRATVPTATFGRKQVAEFTLTVSSPPFNDIEVAYDLQGTAVDGKNYAFVKDTVKVKAGETNAVIKIRPLGDGDGAAERTVRLTLLHGNGYTVHPPARAKITLLVPAG